MGNLSNQYISQSFQSLIHLGSDTTITSASVELQDAVGNGLKLYVNNNGAFKATEISASIISASVIYGLGDVNAFTQSVNNKFAALQNVTSSLINATGSYATTGSNNFIGNQYVNGDVFVTGQLTATSIHTLYETSSVVFSSGSNILGDDVSDTQTLIGTIIMSGSSQLTGSMGVSVDVIVKGAISSSILTGIGNVTNYSASVYNQLYNYSQSVAQVVSSNTQINAATASLYASVAYINQFTSSTNTSLTNLSLSQSIDVSKWNTLGSQSGSFITESETGSFAITGSNSFNGNQTITGSVYGNIRTLTITSQTASMDVATGNFFTLTLVSGSATRLQPTNIKAGQTINLRVTQPSLGFGTLVLASGSIKQPQSSLYSATAASNSVDLLTFISFDTASLYSAAIKNLS